MGKSTEISKKEEVKTLERLLCLIDVQEQKVKTTQKRISGDSVTLSLERLCHTLDIQKGALQRLKIRYNKTAYCLQLFKI
jgi:hypothetical protein